MKIVNQTKGTAISQSTEIADTFSSRSRGLLGRRVFPAGEALVIRPCNSIHMFFMRFSIDVIFVTSQGIVLRVYHNLKPWRLTPVFFNAEYVIELPSGTLAKTNTDVGDEIRLVNS